MKILFPICLICLLAFSSCADKTICPAFQSYYILDEDKREDKFSYFGEDSLPKAQEGIVSKNMFGIIEKPNYFTVATVMAPKNELRARNARMATVKMEVIYPSDEEDSLNLDGVVPDSSQASNQYQSEVNFDLPDYSNLFDTVATVQDTAETKPEYHYNIDQIYYMELIGDEIMEGRQARLDSIQTARDEEASRPSEEVQPKVKQPFFKRLFSKKKKNQDDDPLTEDSADGPALSGESNEEPSEDPPKKEKKKKEKKEKKGFNPFKKKDKDPGESGEGGE